MTLQEFRATKIEVSNIEAYTAKLIGENSGFESVKGAPGNVYAMCLYLEYDCKEGMYFITLANDTHYGTLAELEAELYEFGVDNEYL